MPPIRPVISDDPGLNKPPQTQDAARSFPRSLNVDAIRPSPTLPILSAMNGNFSVEADLFGAEPNIDDPLDLIDADVRPAIDRFAPYRFSFSD